MPPRSGQQFRLSSGDLTAGITGVGATLRSFSVRDRPITASFGEDELAPYGCGQVLAPWPNRLEDGSYRFGEIDATAPLDEPERHNAIHGLVRWLTWYPVEIGATRVRLSCPLSPQPGYPFLIGLELTYELSESRLTITIDVENLDDQTVPFAAGFHPYFEAPRGVDNARLFIPARTHLRTDERGLPIGSEAISSAFCAGLADGDGMSLSNVTLDDCFCDLAAAERPWQAIYRPDAAREERVVLEADGAFRYLMCFTGDTLPVGLRRRAVALEPMTAAPNALRNHLGLVELQPGEHFTSSFSLEVGDFTSA